MFRISAAAGPLLRGRRVFCGFSGGSDSLYLLLALKEILGHAHVSTTEIYTHLGNAQLKQAAQASPFADLDFEQTVSKDKRRD